MYLTEGPDAGYVASAGNAVAVKRSRSAAFESHGVVEFCTSIVHDMQDPITAIALNSEACLRWLDRDTPDLAEAVEAIRRAIAATRRAGQVIQGAAESRRRRNRSSDVDAG